VKHKLKWRKDDEIGHRTIRATVNKHEIFISYLPDNDLWSFTIDEYDFWFDYEDYRIGKTLVEGFVDTRSIAKRRAKRALERIKDKERQR
jgi:uncharacterized protein YjbK